MAQQKLYAGVKLRETRTKHNLTQKEFAARLGISLSYLNQMENNHRPISATVILALAHEFGFDVTLLSVGESDRMVVDMREALADPIFGETQVPLADLQLAATNAPALTRAFLTLHRSHRQNLDRLASVNDALGQDGTALAPLPWEEVRDFFHYCDNYIDSVDRAAEQFSHNARLGRDNGKALRDYLSRQHGIDVVHAPHALRQFSATRNRLAIDAHAPLATQAFQIAHQIALIEYNDLLEVSLDLAQFQTPEARAICKIGLANYFAGAALLPYTAFLDAAQTLRHDLDLLAEKFSASLEQVAHRLSTLQRSGAKGVPFFFVRVDQAGTITKRHSATSLQFARFGGACPLWNVHRAFETPNQYLRQLAQTPDGLRYFSLAKDISRQGGAFHRPKRRYAIGLGCAVEHANLLTYADGMDLENNAAFEPIGISCRICPRPDCIQRALPPMQQKLKVDHTRYDILPYRIG